MLKTVHIDPPHLLSSTTVTLEGDLSGKESKYDLHSGKDYFDLRIVLSNGAGFSCLKIEYPLALFSLRMVKNDGSTAQIHFGKQSKEDHPQTCMFKADGKRLCGVVSCWFKLPDEPHKYQGWAVELYEGIDTANKEKKLLAKHELVMKGQKRLIDVSTPEKASSRSAGRAGAGCVTTARAVSCQGRSCTDPSH